MRRRGLDPDLPDLIRLSQRDGSISVPRFQFGAGEEPLAVVLRVNRLLGAEHDPAGVLDWWLGPNVWLGRPPIELLGVRDADVVAAAADIAEV